MFNTLWFKLYEDSYSYIEEEEEKRLLFHSMDINDSNNLTERNNEQRYRAHVAVKDLHPVVPWTQGEDESRQKGKQAEDPYGSEEKQIRKVIL